MIGLLFLGFWTLYLLFAVFFPWFLFAKAKTRKWLSVISTLLILFIPVAEYLRQLMAFKQECSKNIYFFPGTKIEKPSVLAVSGVISSSKETAYRERDGQKVLGLFFNFSVDYFVKIDGGIDFSQLTRHEIRNLIAETGEIYPFYDKKVNENDKMVLLNKVDYLVYTTSEFRNGLIIIKDFIYDIGKQQVISGASEVSHSKGTTQFHLFDPYTFGVCRPIGIDSYHSNLEELLMKTFK
jgi:hypothetical protein